MNSTILRPLITEKSTENSNRGFYTFAVSKTADKIEIKKEIERLFSVHVTDVRTAVMHGKAHRVGKRRTEVPRSDWKKAFVKLVKGESISLFDVK
jgi:large subunit ribosomal protein L23